MSKASKQKRKTHRWAQKQNTDQFVKQARQSGYRARAVYKLQSIDEKYRLLKRSGCIVDLGAAPGSWCQYVRNKLSDKGHIVAVDLLEVKPIDGVHIIQGDFNEQAIVALVIDAMQNQKATVVLSDMAPNITGVADIDQARFETLFESIMGFCNRAMAADGQLLMKVFVGSAFENIKKQMKSAFKEVIVIKPEASRNESKECFLLARGFQPKND